MEFGYFVLTVAVALVGGVLGVKLKLPAGALLGSMLAVVVVNLTLGHSYFYPNLRVALQLLSGAMIGSKIGRKELMELKTIVLPTVFLLCGVVAFNLIFGSLIYRLSDLDLTTSLFAIAPGGITDMTLVAGDMGGDATVVAILQLFRVLIVFIFMPPMCRRVLKKNQNALGGPPPSAVPMQEDAPAQKLPLPAISYAEGTGAGPAAEGYAGGDGAVVAAARRRFSPADFAAWLLEGLSAFGRRVKQAVLGLKDSKKLLLVLAIAAAGGMALRLLGIPAGAITGSMVFSAAFCVWKGRVAFPRWTKTFVQSMFGGAIGVSIDKERILMMPQLLLPALVMLAGIAVFVVGISVAMRKLFKLDLAVSLLASSPAGVQEMAFLSDDLGADTPKIAVMHTARLVFVLMVFPTMLGLVSRLMS